MAPPLYSSQEITRRLDEAVLPYLTPDGDGFVEEFGHPRRGDWPHPDSGVFEWTFAYEIPLEFNSTGQLLFAYHPGWGELCPSHERHIVFQKEGFFVGVEHVGTSLDDALETFGQMLERHVTPRNGNLETRNP